MQKIKNITKFHYLRVDAKVIITYELSKLEEDLVVFYFVLDACYRNS